MLGHVHAGCIVDCFYAGSELDEILLEIVLKTKVQSRAILV